jgi:hypothetical protein
MVGLPELLFVLIVGLCLTGIAVGAVVLGVALARARTTASDRTQAR